MVQILRKDNIFQTLTSIKHVFPDGNCNKGKEVIREKETNRYFSSKKKRLNDSFEKEMTILAHKIQRRLYENR